MHVDGGTTAPFFIPPETGPMSPEELQALEGAIVYVIVNGQLDGSDARTTSQQRMPDRQGQPVANRWQRLFRHPQRAHT